jgi:hypothetical protein
MGETVILRARDDLLAASSEPTYRHLAAGGTGQQRGRAQMSESFTGAREVAGSRERSAEESAKS